MEHFTAVILFILGASELFLGKNYVVGIILVILSAGSVMEKKSQKYKRRKTKNNRWLKCYLITTTIALLLTLATLLKYFPKSL